jgi:oligopeptide/dipeptide ABC transporter ATP-binding protein
MSRVTERSSGAVYAGELVDGDLLVVDSLAVDLPLEGGLRSVLSDVSFTIGAGEALGLVGESGSGKSMSARAIARLLPPGAVQRGTVRFDDRDVATLRGSALRGYRGEVAMIFQDPRSHINPVRTIGDFMTEALRTNRGVGRHAAADAAITGLSEVGIDDGERRLNQHPQELSGGLLQRVMIATALLTEPRLLLADEPTTALDVTTQAEVMAILDELRRERNMAMLFITHDLELASAVCDRTAVMYAGQIVEQRQSSLLHEDPLHPYTAGLVAARPRIDGDASRLNAIPGRPLSAFEAPHGCAFADRCVHEQPQCRVERPPVRALSDGLVRCVRAHDLRGALGIHADE